MIPICRSLMDDASKKVQIEFIDQLGKIIYSFIPSVPDFLVKAFIKAVPSVPAGRETFRDTERDRAYQCAFNFPAVAFALQKDKWHKISKIYKLLTASQDPKIRQTLASSVHEIAKIVGREITERELVPVFRSYSDDSNIKVQENLFHNMSEFIYLLSPEDRDFCLGYILDHITSELDWKLKLVLISQLIKVCEFIDVSRHFDKLTTVCMNLCCDGFWQIRKKSIALFPLVFLGLDSSKKHLFIEMIDKLFHSPRSSHRKTFVLIAFEMKKVLEQDFYFEEKLECLENDPVFDVRLLVKNNRD